MEARMWTALAACAAIAGCSGTDGSGGSGSTAAAGTGTTDHQGGVVVCPCKVTGGGFVFLDGQRVTFGFNAQPSTKEPTLVDSAGFEAKGQLEMQFHQTANEHGTVSTIGCFPQPDGTVVVRFGGTLRNDGAFTAEVVDRGEPGVNDTIAFEGGGESFGPLDLGGPGPGGGNIQLHELDRSRCEEIPAPPPPCPSPR